MLSIVVEFAEQRDAAEVAVVFSASRRLLDFLPEGYTVSEDRWFIESIIFGECDVLVARHGAAIVSFLALQGDEVRLLHTAPEAIGQGAGQQLLEHAQQRCPAGLHLWCFQKNTAARRFYERHGFVAAEFTDGQRNEEKEPDILYRWAPS